MIPIFIFALLRVLPVVHLFYSAATARSWAAQGPIPVLLITARRSGETQAALQNLYERCADGLILTRMAQLHSFCAAARARLEEL